MSHNEVDTQRINDTIHKILTRREFKQTERSSPISDMIGRIWEGIKEWVENMIFTDRQMETPFQLRPDFFSQNFQNMIKLILVVFAVVFLFFILRLVLKRVYFPGSVKRRRRYAAEDFLEEPDKALEKFKEWMDKKDYTEALRYLFICVLLKLHHDKMITIEKWKTNRNYLMEIQSAKQEMAIPLKELSALFNGCCYGRKTIDENQINTWINFYHELEERA